MISVRSISAIANSYTITHIVHTYRHMGSRNNKQEGKQELKNLEKPYNGFIKYIHTQMHKHTHPYTHTHTDENIGYCGTCLLNKFLL